MNIGTLLLTAALPFAAAVAANTPRSAVEAPAIIGSIERMDPRFDALVPPGTVIEQLTDGHKWTEGPLWVPALKSLLYSDIPNNAIYRWQPGVGASLWLAPSGDTPEVDAGGRGGANGLLLSPGGELILAQHGDRRIARYTASLAAPAPEFETLAASYNGKRLNSPNDLVATRSGDLYFTDPPYGLAGGDDSQAKELAVNGVYRLATDGTLTLLVSDLPRPNGVALSPDERVLYVADSKRSRNVIMAYELLADGGLGEGRALLDSWGDGMAVDARGNLYIAGPGDGVIVVSPEGERLGAFRTGQPTSNCAFGEDGRTLYITSNSRLLRVRLGEAVTSP